MAILNLPLYRLPETATTTRVGVLLIDGFSLLSYAAVTEPLRMANVLSGVERYRVRAIPASGAAAVSSCGVQVSAAAQVGEQVDFDLVIVLAGGDPFAFNDVRILDWLRHLARRNVALGGVSGGPVMLATAQLLNGYRMTVHHEHADLLMEREPAIAIEPESFVVDRDRVTCAGGTAPLELMRALMVQHDGPDLARRVSNWLQRSGMRREGNTRRPGVVERYQVHQPALIEAVASMETHLSDPLRLSDLALLTGVSARQLTRLFKEKLGQSPMEFYSGLRLERARGLLQQTGMKVSEVAASVGYASSSHFSAAYRQRFDRPPREERH